jgi:hypothetical protein
VRVGTVEDDAREACDSHAAQTRGTSYDVGPITLGSYDVRAADPVRSARPAR